MCNENDIFNSTNVVAFSSAIFGAFFGSASAFLLGYFQQKRDLRNKQSGALIATQAALWLQVNTLQNIRLKDLAPLRDDTERFTKLGFIVTLNSNCSVPFSDITFVASLGEPNLLIEIQLAEQNYIIAMRALEVRNKLVEEFNKSESAQKSLFDKNAGVFHVQRSVHDLHILQQATDALYQQFDHAIPQLEKQIKDIRAFVKRKFKKNAIQINPNFEK